MKKCGNVRKILSRYIDKETSDADTIMIKAHLSDCPICREELSELERVKGLVSKIERKTLPQDYLVFRLREAISRVRDTDGILSLVGMGNFARKLIPVPVAAMIASILFLIFVSMQPVTETSLEDQMLSGNAATTDTALELILGSQS